MKISDIRNELNRINMHENPIEIPGTAKEMLQGAGVMENDKLIPLQNIDSIIAQDGAKSNCGKPWFNTIPFGTPSDTFPYLLAVCRGKSTLNNILRNIKEQCSKMVEEDRYKDTEKIVVLLTDKWDNNIFEKYDKVFLNHVLRDKFRFIILLVTSYGYTQIPFFPNNRNALEKLVNEVVEDDLTIENVYELLESESFEYIYWGGTWKQYEGYTYHFDIMAREWRKINVIEELGYGKIPKNALLKFFNSVLWIKDRRERRIEPKSITSAKDYPSYTLHIFGKEVCWYPVSKDEDKLFGELTENMEEFMEKCDKKWRK
ncbi:hypothetical protein [Schwartzia succinivorans]|jgi:hypothetical protein|uniref:Uncharacterized protein n=1 Tax=Schwartzia succinivorans DSM 10502 TaxID=1123243 RepID=A0A1M4YKM7_9FIRM|nr:hypothetical protein [Schwartzia succinivorans]SHF06223.1 hypothetical protein SAMN02745190_01786 [Schwartzia succinivorans DSM 10502]